ncbi:MAG TPA: hypothetical protein VH253_08020 [Phycisphaerae bacterium]|nr:hypothetical protein [Phycisphaerae bacterium]
MLEGAVHRWEYIEFGSLAGMNDAGLNVSARLRPTPEGVALGVIMSSSSPSLPPPLGGDIAIRLHTQDGVENAVPLRPRVSAMFGNGLGSSGTAEVLFAWRKQPFAAGIFELSTERQTCLLAIPYGFLNDPRQLLHTASDQNARKAPGTIPTAPRVLHVLPQWIRYPTTSLDGGATLDMAQRNPFEGITKLQLLQPAVDPFADDMMHVPRTSIVLYIHGHAVTRSRCVAILRSEQGNSLRRADRHITFTRPWRLPVPCWGELAVELDGTEVHRELMPSSLFAYAEGLPGDPWLSSPRPYLEPD